MTQQLIQLRVIPRMRVVHTSEHKSGQIYLPAVNWLMLALVITLVLYFQSSNAMGAAYGIAVTGTMLITDFFALAVVIHVRRWSWMIATLLILPFMIIDSLFLAANTLKFVNGGWFTVSFSLLVLFVIMTWLRGARSIQSYELTHSQKLSDFVKKIAILKPYRSDGTSVYLTSDETIAPMALVLMAERLHAMQQKIICLNIKIEEVPRVPEDQRHNMQELGQDIYLIILRYGYSDQINLPEELAKLFPTDTTVDHYSYLINRWSLEVARGAGWAVWRKRMFALLLRNSTPQARMFAMPPDRVIEIGARLIL